MSTIDFIWKNQIQPPARSGSWDTVGCEGSNRKGRLHLKEPSKPGCLVTPLSVFKFGFGSYIETQLYTEAVTVTWHRHRTAEKNTQNKKCLTISQLLLGNWHLSLHNSMWDLSLNQRLGITHCKESLTVSLLFYHNTLTGNIFHPCVNPPSIHSSLHPSVHPSLLLPSPPLTPTVPGATLCLLKRCVLSECSAWHQYGWVTEVTGSNTVHCFAPALAAPLPMQIRHLGASERVSVGLWLDVYACMCGYLALWFCPLLCINMCVCVSSRRMHFLTCVFAHSAAALRVSITGLGPLPGRHNEHVVSEARGTAAQIPTRAAGGESVPAQLYHCMELGSAERKMSRDDQYYCSSHTACFSDYCHAHACEALWAPRPHTHTHTHRNLVDDGVFPKSYSQTSPSTLSGFKPLDAKLFHCVLDPFHSRHFDFTGCAGSLTHMAHRNT